MYQSSIKAATRTVCITSRIFTYIHVIPDVRIGYRWTLFTRHITPGLGRYISTSSLITPDTSKYISPSRYFTKGRHITAGMGERAREEECTVPVDTDQAWSCTIHAYSKREYGTVEKEGVENTKHEKEPGE
jgi:hypothetical protein